MGLYSFVVGVISGLLARNRKKTPAIKFSIRTAWTGHTEYKTRLRIDRMTFTDKSTIGELFVDDKFFCYTLEDTCRNKKIPKMTAIPSGTYRVNMSFSKKMNKFTPELEDVPGFTNIRIHQGNTPLDTEGCILVGRRRGENTISESGMAFDALNEVIKDMLTKGKVYISVIGGLPYAKITKA